MKDQIKMHQEYSLKSVPIEWIDSKGRDSSVLICDSAIDTAHPMIRQNVGIVKRFVPGREFYAESHCTHVAGTICQLAQECTLNIAHVSQTSSGRVEWLRNGIEWALKLQPDVINLSLAYTIEDPEIKEMLERLDHNGTIVVSASSNGTYPSIYPFVIAVASFEQTDIYYNLVAPHTLTSAWPFGNEKEMSGHSVSAAFVSGIAALAKSYDRSVTRKDFLNQLQPVNRSSVKNTIYKILKQRA